MATHLSMLRRTSWCLLVAFLFAVFAPTAKTVWAGEASQVVWVHLCTADGGRLIALDENGDPATDLDSGSLHAGHCLLCFHPCDIPSCTAAVPTAAVTVLRFQPPGKDFVHENRVWKTPPSRAPPVPA